MLIVRCLGARLGNHAGGEEGSAAAQRTRVFGLRQVYGVAGGLQYFERGVGVFGFEVVGEGVYEEGDFGMLFTPIPAFPPQGGRGYRGVIQAIIPYAISVGRKPRTPNRAFCPLPLEEGGLGWG